MQQAAKRKWDSIAPPSFAIALIVFAVPVLPLRAAPSVAALPLRAAQGNGRVPDFIQLAGGSRVEGRVVYENATTLVLRTGSGEKRFDRKNVKDFRSRTMLHRDAFDRWSRLTVGAARGTLDLARVCKNNDLLEDARTFAWWVLLLEPGNSEAQALLETRKRGDSFEVRAGKNRWIPYQKLLAIRPDWDDAFDTTTTHYVVRTNLDQDSAVKTAIDLESFHRAFYDLFGTELELFETVEPLQVDIHADRESYPAFVDNRPAFTDFADNVVHVDASAGLRIHQLFHEATHQLINATTRSARSGNATIPGWLDEGLAEYLRAGMSGFPGRRYFAPGGVLEGHFAEHAEAKSPYDLSRVLNFDSADFLASSRPDLKYAQAYTLVHFCMEGEDRRYRAGFFEFLRSVWKGGTSSLDFKRSLKIDPPAFEKAWTAFVRATAGKSR